MRWSLPLLFLVATAFTLSAHAQPIPDWSTEDFRLSDRPKHAFTGGPPGGPSLPPDAMLFRDSLGDRSPGERVRGIDMDLGRPMVERPGVTGSTSDSRRDLPAPSERG